MHSTFASLSMWLYGALLVGELAYFFNSRMISENKIVVQIKKASLIIERILCNNIFSKILALIALISIVITGLLGGVMVYGVSADPLAGFVLNILGISL